MPKSAEIHLFVLKLQSRSDLRKTLDTFDERIFDHLPQAPGEGQKPFGRERLVPEEDDKVIKPQMPDLGDDTLVQMPPKIDTDNFRAILCKLCFNAPKAQNGRRGKAMNRDSSGHRLKTCGIVVLATWLASPAARKHSVSR